MNQRFKHILSLFLILVFGFFSVGVPVVQYLCPMMSSQNPTCDMSPTGNTSGTTLSSVTPDCCAKKLGAERNTIPFLKAKKFQTLSIDVPAFVVEVTSLLSTEPAACSIHSFIHQTASSPPLYVLHSALLI